MYTTTERQEAFHHILSFLENQTDVIGVVQLGSGVIGYQDAYSDIDLMVAATDSAVVKERLVKSIRALGPIVLKEKQFAPDIFLLIVLFDNRLELNLSIAPFEKVSARSPLWNVVLDQDGALQQQMLRSQERLNQQSIVARHEDLPFEFAYTAFAFDKEWARGNTIYALSLLETLREWTRFAQALKEGKKVHQFKAYHTLDSQFIEAYLQTFPSQLDATSLKAAKQAVLRLFKTVLTSHPVITVDAETKRLLALS